MASGVSDLFDPRVAAWMIDTGSTEKALEFEALCHSKLPACSSAAGGDERWMVMVMAVVVAENGIFISSRCFLVARFVCSVPLVHMLFFCRSHRTVVAFPCICLLCLGGVFPKVERFKPLLLMFLYTITADLA